MIKLEEITIAEALNAMKCKKFSAVELVDAHIERIQELNPKLNAFTQYNFDNARKAALQSDKRISSGDMRSLEGIPIAVKSLYCTQGITSDASSHILKDFKPTYESQVTTKIQEHGGINIGKTNMDEFAMGSTTTTSCHGPTINPLKDITRLDTPLVPGGSSGGSAAAVASSMCLAALGTDTGGSIRQPAAFCGIVGIKPTYGRCSRFGMISFASSLDQAGPLAKTVEDAAIMLEAICGYDGKDSTSAQRDVPPFRDAINKSVKNVKIGIPSEYQVDGISEDVLIMWKKSQDILMQEGAEIIPISLPHTSYALPVYYAIAPAEAVSNLRRYDGVRYGHRTEEKCNDFYSMVGKTRDEGFGDEVKRRIILGSYILSSLGYTTYCLRAQKIRRRIVEDFITAFKSVDVILTPTTLCPAFALNEKIQDPMTIYFNDVLTVPASLAGLPAMSLPMHKSTKERLPLSMQIIGRPFDEESVLAIGSALERAAQYK